MKNEVDQSGSKENLTTDNQQPELPASDSPEISVENSDDFSLDISQDRHKLRFGLLAALVSGSLLIFGRSLLDNNIGKPTPFIFPDKIELVQTQLKVSQTKPTEPIVDNKEFFGKPRFLTGSRYEYFVDEIPLTIDLRYAVGTEGELYVLVKELTEIKIEEEQLRLKAVRKDPTGYHAIFDYQDRLYLTACVNPRGISTVTREQFDDNASSQILDRDVIVGWLLGQKDLRDRRCLFTIISTPLPPNSDRQERSEKLEKLWIAWYEWWKPRFPQP
ncbi:MAG: cyanoexosortase A system-associated protein [Pseudanabaena sp.]|nr:MAG: cyanoexosortase A system-associated protein [Pseudanabaena sp.]